MKWSLRNVEDHFTKQNSENILSQSVDVVWFTGYPLWRFWWDFSTKIYAFWGAGKGGEIKKMETICLPFKNVGFTGDSFCHELTKRSQKHHTKILYMYLYDSNEICKGRLKILKLQSFNTKECSPRSKLKVKRHFSQKEKNKYLNRFSLASLFREIIKLLRNSEFVI